ncbi:MAG: GNAT family N-acetyltransferase [Oscillospiraceae bacterium]|nr:GNAT family N-acetyltransferase [Oscillospiraceae bacterium]
MNYWQGDKICLRAMEESDADFFYETLQDIEIQKNESDIRVPMSRKACADFVAEQAAKGNDNTSPFLMIEDNNGNRVGMASPSIEDSRVGVFTSGIFIKPEFQRRGYAKEALFMIMRFYFNQLRCQKFNVTVYSYNEPSNRLFEAIGLVVEGRRRNTVFHDGEFYDEILYGLTKDEFSELVK